MPLQPIPLVKTCILRQPERDLLKTSSIIAAKCERNLHCKL